MSAAVVMKRKHCDAIMTDVVYHDEDDLALKLLSVHTADCMYNKPKFEEEARLLCLSDDLLCEVLAFLTLHEVEACSMVASRLRGLIREKPVMKSLFFNELDPSARTAQFALFTTAMVQLVFNDDWSRFLRVLDYIGAQYAVCAPNELFIQAFFDKHDEKISLEQQRLCIVLPDSLKRSGDLTYAERDLYNLFMVGEDILRHPPAALVLEAAFCYIWPDMDPLIRLIQIQQRRAVECHAWQSRGPLKWLVDPAGTFLQQQFEFRSSRFIARDNLSLRKLHSLQFPVHSEHETRRCIFNHQYRVSKLTFDVYLFFFARFWECLAWRLSLMIAQLHLAPSVQTVIIHELRVFLRELLLDRPDLMFDRHMDQVALCAVYYGIRFLQLRMTGPLFAVPLFAYMVDCYLATPSVTVLVCTSCAASGNEVVACTSSTSESLRAKDHQCETKDTDRSFDQMQVILNSVHIGSSTMTTGNVADLFNQVFKNLDPKYCRCLQ